MNEKEIKIRIAKSGNSKVLKEWQKHSSITKEQFIEAVEWVCSDRLNAAGLTPTGWEKLRVRQDYNTTTFRHLNGFLWSGASFPMEVPEDQKKYYGDSINVMQKIALCSWDQV